MGKHWLTLISLRLSVPLIGVILLCSSQLYAQQPVASFSTTDTIGCAPFSVAFTNNSTNATNFIWDFGNGNTSTLANPTAIYVNSGIYTITLIAGNSASGLSDTISATNYINVVPDPTATFTATPLSACLAGNSIQFTNSSVNASTYTWDFGDGNSSTLANPTHTYASAGTYTVKLIARSNLGCENIQIQNNYITIHPNPNAYMNVSNRSSCDSTEIFTFYSTGTNDISWLWTFGDGNTSTLQNPTHVYGQSGTFTVTLTVVDNNGCTKTRTKPDYVTIGSSLNPTFTESQSSGCAPLTVDFSSTVNNGLTWNWDFGDGNTSNAENPSHTYNSPGNYDITLTATTTNGCNGTATYSSHILVDPFPNAAFNITNSTGCAPFNAQFTNTSTGAVSWLWDFGNGDTSSAQHPLYTYDTPGIYDVQLIAYSPNGCADTIIQTGLISVSLIYSNFTAAPRWGCPGITVPFVPNNTGFTSYFWDFGDGNTSTLTSPVHTYNTPGYYDVSLTVTNVAGCSNTITKSNFVRVVNPGTSYTVPDTIIGCTPTTATFTDPTTFANSWLWDFGNGDTSSQQNPVYIYDTAGIYTVTLIASMAGGCFDTISPYAIYEIVQTDDDSIQVLSVSNCSPYDVSFYYDTTDVISFLWNFGDGDTSSLPNPTHTYLNPGTYTVTLEVDVNQGCTKTLTYTLVIGHPNPITASNLKPCVGDTIQYTGFNPLFVSYLWDFGNGDTSTLANPSYAYPNVGSYVATLTVEDNAGCIHTFIHNDPVVLISVFADFIVNGPTSGCNVLSAQFVNNSIGGTSYLWDFGDGNTSTAAQPTHVYITPGTYDVSLTISDSGCVHTNTKPNYISVNNFLANFTYTQSSTCFPITVNFTDQSLNAVSWSWDFGDSIVSNLQNPVHTFYSPPNGPIQLTITDSNGCQITRSKTNITFDIIDFGVSDSVGCIPFTTTFTDNSTNAIGWNWDFGDGNTSPLQNPTHTYNTAGSYDVTLIVDFASGCTDTLYFPGRFNFSIPVADFSSPTNAACSPANIDFINNSTGATSYLWDFGDSTNASLSDPSHIYNIPGYYTVSLIAYNNDGCSDTNTINDFILIPGTYTNFTVNSTVGCPMMITQFTDLSINASTWNWNFGDGYSSTQQHPTHLYADTGTFQVTLITTDTIGCSSVFTLPTPINIYPYPVSGGVVSNPNGCIPASVNFQNLSTNANSYIWSFGNGDTSHATDPNYTYSTPGTYNVELIAISQYGCSDTFQLSPSITVNGNPQASFIMDSLSGCAPNNVNFYSLSTDTIGANYLWNFDNGSTSSGLNSSVYYSLPGTYNVTLSVTNSNGCEDSLTIPVNVPSKPSANASISDTSGCAPLFCQFSEQAIGAVSYYWNFDDGNTSDLANPSHIYIAAGTYNPYLVVFNSFGCTDTFNFTFNVVVYNNPKAVFTAGGGGCNPYNAQFTNNSVFDPGATFYWDFKNGITSNLQNPTSVFDTAGLYNISLTVTNLSGCWDSTSKALNVHQTPVAYAIVDNQAGCEPLTVNFSNTSQNGSSFVWNFGNNSLSTNVNPQYTYNQIGSFIPSVVAISPLGCADTFTFASPINVSTTPIASFSATDTIGCVGSNISFANQSTNTLGATYQWTLENGVLSNAVNPTITLTTPGVHDITLVVVNSGGCGDTVFEPLYLHVRDTIAPAADKVYSASVLNNTSVELTWDQTNDPNALLYRLFRLDAGSGTYVNIYTDSVHTPNSDTVRRYVDNTLATLYNTYTYKLQTVDVCDYKLALTELDHSTTMNLETVTVGADVYLSWNAYEGCNLSGYQIERTNLRTQELEILDTTGPLIISYIDTVLICPDVYSYRIRALDLCNTLYTAVSDTDNARPYLNPGVQVVDIIRSTVVDDIYILTEWTLPNRDPDRVVSYEVYRSTDNNKFFHLASVPHFDLSYLDYNVDVDNQQYYYQIIVSNDCSIPNIESNTGSSILLKADWKNDKTYLDWTPYERWTDGVGSYAIEEMDESGNWILIKIVDKDTHSIEFED